MNRKQMLSAAALVLSVLLCSQASAEWAMPNLNPWGKTSARSTPKSSNSWWPSSGKSSQPSTLTKVSRGTQSMLKKTGAALNPWSEPAAPEHMSPTGIRKTTRPAAKADDDNPWWNPWPKEADNSNPQTVSDFLKMKKPGFND